MSLPDGRSAPIFDGPLEGAEPKVGEGLILSAECFQDVRSLVVRDKGEDGMVLDGPGMVAQVGLPFAAAPAGDILPAGESPLTELLQDFYDFLIVGLVVCDKNGFHTDWAFLSLRFS